MAPRKQPRELAELKGATKKNPQRYRNTPPKSEYDIGDPPKGQSKRWKELWKEVVKYCPAGVLTGAERHTLAVYCDLREEYEKAPDTIPTARIQAMLGILHDFAMNPTARQRFNVAPPKKQADPKKKKNDNFDDFP